jgi:hypothetical protein
VLEGVRDGTIGDSPRSWNVAYGYWNTGTFAASISTALIAHLLLAQGTIVEFNGTFFDFNNLGVTLRDTLAFEEWANCHALFIILHAAECQVEQKRG